MGANLYYKKYVDKLINVAPASIEIKRVSIVDDGFGGETKKEITLPPQTVTFYKKKSQREYVSDAGQTVGYMATTIEKILTRFDCDIQEGDTFTLDRTYRVTLINSYLDICKQVELEVIK